MTDHVGRLYKMTGKTVPASSISLLRDWVIPELLGNHSSSVLYWSGKKLARKLPFSSMVEVCDFFEKVGFGTLTVIQTKRREIELELAGEYVQNRYEGSSDPSFFLEAGFIAEQIQQQKGVLTESVFRSKKRDQTAIITVQWDSKDPILSEEETTT